MGGLVSALSTLEAPLAVLAATEGIGLAALGLGKDVYVDLLYKSQVRPKLKFGSLPTASNLGQYFYLILIENANFN